MALRIDLQSRRAIGWPAGIQVLRDKAIGPLTMPCALRPPSKGSLQHRPTRLARRPDWLRSVAEQLGHFFGRCGCRKDRAAVAQAESRRNRNLRSISAVSTLRRRPSPRSKSPSVVDGHAAVLKPCSGIKDGTAPGRVCTIRALYA